MWVFNKTFFNFTIGFMAILFFAFAATVLVNYLDTQRALENDVNLEAVSGEPTT